MSTRRPPWIPVFALLALVAAACSSGDGGTADDDATAPAGGVQTPAGERQVQFEGAGEVKLFGTFTMPATPAGASVPGVLLVPTAGAGGLLGQSGVADPMGQDLAKTFAGTGVAAYR